MVPLCSDLVAACTSRDKLADETDSEKKGKATKLDLMLSVCLLCLLSADETMELCHVLPFVCGV